MLTNIESMVTNKIIVSRLQNWNNVELEVIDNHTRICDTTVKQVSNHPTYGYCDILNDQLIVVFTFEGKNFLSLNGNLLELTPSIAIKYSIAQERNKESWFSIMNGEEILYEIHYINPHEPFVLPDPFAYDEDYNTTNFAHHLAEYFKRIKENPGDLLFKS